MQVHISDSLDFVFPLPLGEAHQSATLTTDDNEIFLLYAGLVPHMIQMLTEKSCDRTDEELLHNTQDYARFCEGSYAEWYAKERYPFALLSEEGDLAGVIWFGPKELPRVADVLSLQTETEWDTFAIRTYIPFRGKRLARPFASTALEIYLTLRPGRKIWLETDRENTGAQALYSKLHFREIGYTDTHRLVMVLE